MRTKTYIAARYVRRPEMERVAHRLNKEGFDIVSRWVFGGEEGKTEQDIALLDWEDIQAANFVLSFTEPQGGGGGRHVEFGMAYTLGKPCTLIGPREVIFHHLPNVMQFDTLDDFLQRRREILQ